MVKNRPVKDVIIEQIVQSKQALIHLSSVFSTAKPDSAPSGIVQGIIILCEFLNCSRGALFAADGRIYKNSESTSTNGLTYNEISLSTKTVSGQVIEILCESQQVGVLCFFFDDPARTLTEIEKETLQISSEMFGSALSRSNIELSNQELDLRFRSVLDNLQDGVTIGDLDDRLLYVNHRYAQMLGYTVEELIGRRAYRFLIPTDEHHKVHQGTSRRQSGLSDAYECTQITKSGERIVTIINACPYRNVRGEVIGNIAAYTDITAQRQTEIENARLQKQLNRAQKMEAVGQMAAGFSHDLNNSLTAIMGHLNFIKLQPNLSEQIVSSVNAALSGCSNAGELLRKVLTFSSDSPVKTNVDDLKSVVEECMELTKALIPKNTSVRISGQAQDYPVNVDRTLVVQAITNLVINAAQSMKGGGTISFSFSSTDLNEVSHYNRQARPGRYWVLTVGDTGLGIAEEVQSRIFEPFFSTKGTNNSGLGLSMVYACMQRHKGWIEVDSSPGSGTAFSLYFPDPSAITLSSQVESQKIDSKLDKPISLGTILVIDDEPVLAELACSFLERAGFKTVNYSSPLDAFAWYKDNFQDVSLILLDMKMPECDGAEAFERIKEINPQAQVVLISGYVDDENVSKLLSRGAISFIQKPVKYSELVDWVKKTLKVSPSFINTDTLYN